MKNRNTKFLIGLCCVLASCGSTTYPIESITNTNLVLKNTDEFKEAKSMNALGNQKLLVIPVEFKGEREFNDEDLTRIERGFFEDNLSQKEGKNYYSVKEFYKKSSMNQLHIEGEVTDVLKVPYMVDEMINDNNYFPGVPAQYFMDQENISNEFFQSYDQDKDGYVYVTGRSKNVIVTQNGKNIYPEEIELLLSKIPEIQECMVYGKEVEGEKELIISVKVIPNMEEIENLHGKDLSEEEIHKIIWNKIKEVNKGLTSYKAIKNLEIKHDEFAKTTTMKIKRYVELQKDKEKNETKE